MDNDTLWNTFTHSGKIEDYLRYRGVEIPLATNSAQKEGSGYGDSTQTASNDRRPDSAGVRNPL